MDLRKKFLSVSVVLAMLLVFIPASFVAATEPPFDICTVSFEYETGADGLSLAKGQVIDDEFAAWGISVSTSHGSSHPAIIFESDNPSPHPRFLVVYPGLNIVLNLDFAIPLPESSTSMIT